MDTGTIKVYQGDGMLSFTIISPRIEGETERGINFTTGVKGFLNMVKISDEKGFGLIRISKIVFNGMELERVNKEEFWNQVKKWGDENN